MIRVLNKEKCCGCHACFTVCPQKCISMLEDDEGFKYPFVSTDNCIDCKLCEKICPFQREGDPLSQNLPLLSLAAKTRIDSLLSESSSGGIFSELASYILEKKGIVYGASFSTDYRTVHHIRIDNVANLKLLRGSKYLQSDIGDAFTQAKMDLKNGKLVLFSGTPCQIAGLKALLGKPYANLLLIEIVCHGVPSQLLWRRYLDFFEENNTATVSDVNFRCKKKSRGLFGQMIKSGKGIYFMSKEEDPYFRMFLRNYCLRPSCYSCSIKNSPNQSDISLGDCWGADEFVPELSSKLGLSLVLAHTEKGVDIINEIESKIESTSVLFEKALSNNPAVNKSCQKPIKRDLFYKDLQLMPFKQFLKKYGVPDKKTQLKNLIKKIRFFRAFKNMGDRRFDYGLYICMTKNKNHK